MVILTTWNSNFGLANIEQKLVGFYNIVQPVACDPCKG